MKNVPESDKRTALRRLPGVDALLERDELAAAVVKQGRIAVADAVRRTIDAHRKRLIAEEGDCTPPEAAQLAREVVNWLDRASQPVVRPVINATGVLLHTGLGRAPMAKEAVEAAAGSAAEYCSVEMDLATGARTQRSRAVERTLCRLLGSEAALVVNNNAAATALAVATLAAGKEVIVSHGELIEIGGGYRLPEVITGFGAELRPVGTTNKTRLSDYENAIGERTGAILVVHPSNYVVQGFTEKPSLADLVAMAGIHGIPLIHDIGSGALVNVGPMGSPGEPLAAESLRDGADLVLFSGDKLLGGPQCGVIAGRAELVDRAMRHPLSRAVRIDKMTLAAMDATLRLYLDPDRAPERVPLLRLLSQSEDSLRARSEALVAQLEGRGVNREVRAEPDDSYAGGGSAPGQALPSWSVVVEPGAGSTADDLARRLRTARIAVLGRISGGRVILNLRSVLPEQDAPLSEALEAVLSGDG